MRAAVPVATLLMTMLMTVTGTGGAQATEGETWAFLYADKETSTATYPPAQATSRSEIQAMATRTGTGTYTVRLANAGASGVPIVTAVNDQGVHCQLSAFFRSAPDEIVRIACYKKDVPTDSKFTLSFFSTPPDSGAAGAYGYVHDDQPTQATYVNPATRYDSTGGRVEINRSTQDSRVWTVRFFGQSFNTAGGNVQVSAVGTRPARCGVVGWSRNSVGVDAQVRCDNLSGVTSFTPQWTLVYTHERNIVGGTGGFFGYLQANQPSTDFYTPSAPRNRAPLGLTHTIRRDAVGRYEAQIHGPLKGVVDVHASVNGPTDKYCTLVGWSLTPEEQPAARVGISCRTTDGAPADAVFTLIYYSP